MPVNYRGKATIGEGDLAITVTVVVRQIGDNASWVGTVVESASALLEGEHRIVLYNGWHSRATMASVSGKPRQVALNGTAQWSSPVREGATA